MANDLHGLLVIDKPTGITSRAAVNRVQECLPPRTRIGHTGTLDPLATGVLVLCVGRATRLAEFVQGMDKTYRTMIVLGARSDTDDADGVITHLPVTEPIAESAVRACLDRFTGDIEQRPPAYSAIKLDGKRAHELARRGRPIDIAPRKVTIYGIELVRYEWPELDLEIHCGKGTYIRSLARDLGEQSGCGAYVKTLRRVRVGPFGCDDALAFAAPESEFRSRLLPPSTAVAHLPSICLPDGQIEYLRCGQTISVADVADAPLCSVFDLRGHLVAVGNVHDGHLHPEKNLT
jgi:tRNA pseudouridine55 synthase